MCKNWEEWSEYMWKKNGTQHEKKGKNTRKIRVYWKESVIRRSEHVFGFCVQIVSFSIILPLQSDATITMIIVTLNRKRNDDNSNKQTVCDLMRCCWWPNEILPCIPKATWSRAHQTPNPCIRRRHTSSMHSALDVVYNQPPNFQWSRRVWPNVYNFRKMQHFSSIDLSIPSDTESSWCLLILVSTYESHLRTRTSCRRSSWK